MMKCRVGHKPHRGIDARVVALEKNDLIRTHLWNVAPAMIGPIEDLIRQSDSTVRKEQIGWNQVAGAYKPAIAKGEGRIHDRAGQGTPDVHDLPAAVQPSISLPGMVLPYEVRRDAIDPVHVNLHHRRPAIGCAVLGSDVPAEGVIEDHCLSRTGYCANQCAGGRIPFCLNSLMPPQRGGRKGQVDHFEPVSFPCELKRRTAQVLDLHAPLIAFVV